MCSKELELTAGERLRRKVVRDRVTRFDVEQQASSACLQSKVKYYERRRSRSEKRDRAARSDSGGRESSTGEPGSKCNRERQRVWMFFSAVHKKSVCIWNVWFCTELRFKVGTRP